MNEGMKNKRVIVFSAYPKLAGKLKTIFSTVEGSIQKRLENPPELRYGGWSLWTYDRARIIDREMIRVRNEDKTIDLYRDGSLIFVAAVSPSFLASGPHNEPGINPTKPGINPTALVEVVYNFTNFYKLVLEDFREKPEEISIRVDFRNMHLGGTKTYLPISIYHPPIQCAPDDSGTIVKDFRVEDFHVGVISFEVLKEIYLWFGWEEDKIPYTKTEGEIKMVDSEKIANV